MYTTKQNVQIKKLISLNNMQAGSTFLTVHNFILVKNCNFKSSNQILSLQLKDIVVKARQHYVAWRVAGR